MNRLGDFSIFIYVYVHSTQSICVCATMIG